MKILLDHDGTLRLQFCSETIDAGDRQLHFTAVEPARSVVVFHNGLDPAKLGGAVVDAGIGIEIGLTGYVRSANVGVQHSMIAVFERVNGPPDDTLSRLLAAGLQD